VKKGVLAVGGWQMIFFEKTRFAGSY